MNENCCASVWLPCRMCLCLKRWHCKGQPNFSCSFFSCFYLCSLQCCFNVWKGYLRSLVLTGCASLPFSICMIGCLKAMVHSGGFPLLICKDKCFFLHDWCIKGQLHFCTLTVTTLRKSFVLMNLFLPSFPGNWNLTRECMEGV